MSRDDVVIESAIFKKISLYEWQGVNLCTFELAMQGTGTFLNMQAGRLAEFLDVSESALAELVGEAIDVKKVGGVLGDVEEIGFASENRWLTWKER